MRAGRVPAARPGRSIQYLGVADRRRELAQALITKSCGLETFSYCGLEVALLNPPGRDGEISSTVLCLSDGTYLAEITGRLSSVRDEALLTSLLELYLAGLHSQGGRPVSLAEAARLRIRDRRLIPDYRRLNVEVAETCRRVEGAVAQARKLLVSRTSRTAESVSDPASRSLDELVTVLDAVLGILANPRKNLKYAGLLAVVPHRLRAHCRAEKSME